MDPLKKAAEDKCLSFETIHETLKESEILRDQSLKLTYRVNPLTDKPEAAEFSSGRFRINISANVSGTLLLTNVSIRSPLRSFHGRTIHFIWKRVVKLLQIVVSAERYLKTQIALSNISSSKSLNFNHARNDLHIL